jgi:hypothetical protein
MQSSVRPAAAAEGVTAGALKAPSFAQPAFAQPEVTANVRPHLQSRDHHRRSRRCARVRIASGLGAAGAGARPYVLCYQIFAHKRLSPELFWANSRQLDDSNLSRGKGVLSGMPAAMQDLNRSPSRDKFVEPPRRRIAKSLRPSRHAHVALNAWIRLPALSRDRPSFGENSLPTKGEP